MFDTNTVNVLRKRLGVNLRMVSQTPFTWRDSTLFLRSGSETDFKGVLFDAPEKWPSFVKEDPELCISEDHTTLPVLLKEQLHFPEVVTSYSLMMKFREMFSDMEKRNDDRLVDVVNHDGGETSCTYV